MFLGHRSNLLCVLGFVVCGGSSLDSISKDFRVFPLIEKGFPKIKSCVLCMVIHLVVLVTAAIVYCIATLFMVQVHVKLQRNYMCMS
jgi:hypothetical protein